MANKLNLLNSTKVKEELLVKQQKEINKIYKHTYDNIEKELEKLKYKSNISSILMTEELNKLKGKIAKEYNYSRALIKKAVEDNMETVCTEVVNDSTKFVKKIGFSIEEAFSHVPRDVVKNVSSGKIYQEDWTLTKALWGDDQKKLHEINQIIAEGIAQNKTTYEMAKDLEMYVNPEAEKPWDWNKVYPGVRKKVDYNAQRLARTLVNHAYQQSVIETSKPNPFIIGIEWLSAHAHGRTCELCIQRATQDQFGLGKGVFPKDQVPLDHPNGLCTLASKIEEDFTKIADRIADWALGKEDPDLDNYANALYNTDKFTAPKNPLDKMDKSTADYLKDKFDGYENNSIALDVAAKKAQKSIDTNSPSSSKLGIQYDKDKLDYINYLKLQLEKKKAAATVTPVVNKVKQAAKISKDLGEDAEQTVERIKQALIEQTNNKSETKSYIDNKLQEWLKIITDEEKEAIIEYTGSYYRQMNSIMRGTSTLKENSFTYKTAAEKIENATKALDKAVLDKDIYVRRGASKTSFAGMFGNSAYTEAKDIGGTKWIEINKDNLTGQIVQDNGFLSTTPFTGKGFGGGINFKIELPKGTKAMYVNPISNHSNEEEIIVQRGTQYIVTKIEKSIMSEQGEDYTVYLKAIVK